MATPPRLLANSGIYHVMNRGSAHQIVFFGREDRLEFGRLLAEVYRDHGVVTLAYCLMDNHFHLLLRAPDDTLPEAMQHLLSVYTRHTNDRIGRDGPLFRGRFHSIPVDTDSYLVWVTRYIHLNPLDLPGVNDPLAYRWSSLTAYAGLRAEPSFVDTAPALELFGHHRADLVAFTKGVASGTTPGPSAVRAGLDAAAVDSLVRCALAVEDIAGHSDGSGYRSTRAMALALLADRSSPELAAAILSLLPERSPRAEREALRRARRRHDVDPVLRRVTAWVITELSASDRQPWKRCA